jgi:hypothetical protein
MREALALRLDLLESRVQVRCAGFNMIHQSLLASVGAQIESRCHPAHLQNIFDARRRASNERCAAKLCGVRVCA